MMGYGIGAFAVGPLRQLADLQLSDVCLGATAIAVVLIPQVPMAGQCRRQQRGQDRANSGRKMLRY
jgi:hypothetical protein